MVQILSSTLKENPKSYQKTTMIAYNSGNRDRHIWIKFLYIIAFVIISNTVSAQYINPSDTISIKKSLPRPSIKGLDAPQNRSILNTPQKNQFHPNRLFIPFKSKNGDILYFSEEELKRNVLSIDYYSYGIVGYYDSLIKLGYVGESTWKETRKQADILTDLKKDILDNLADLRKNDALTIVYELSASRNPFLRVVGGILGAMHNGTRYKEVGPHKWSPPPPKNYSKPIKK